MPRPRPRFAHGTRITLDSTGGGDRLDLFGCFHVSQRNTFTGRLTPAMLREVLTEAARTAGCPPPGARSRSGARGGRGPATGRGPG
ncbi:hypothetical protein SFUMM280S_05566 [Streptomyces fumanus]